MVLITKAQTQFKWSVLVIVLVNQNNIVMLAMRAVFLMNVLASKTLAFNIFFVGNKHNLLWLACHSDGELNYQYISEKGRIILLWNLVPWIALYTQVEILDCTV